MSLQITVITAVLNRADTLAAALRSVHAQSWPAVEHIVVDGGSTDGSLAIVAECGERISKVIHGPDAGIYDALNKGINAATGDVIGFMHADDEFASDGVLAQVGAAFEDPTVGAVYGDLVYVRRSDPGRVVRYWRAGKYSRELLPAGWMPPHPTFYVRRSVYEQCGVFDTRYRIAADYENMLRILWQGRVKAVYIPSLMVRMRVGGVSNMSARSIWRKSLEDYRVLRSVGVGGLRALVMKNVGKLPQFAGVSHATSNAGAPLA